MNELWRHGVITPGEVIGEGMSTTCRPKLLICDTRASASITQPVRWPLFCHRRANAVEQSAWTASATGHHFRTIQTIVENVYVWSVGSRRLVFER